MPTRRIDAGEAVTDIRSGMTDSELMEKYELSEPELARMRSTLVYTGLLVTEETKDRPIAPEPVTEDGAWSCLFCKEPQPPGRDHCPKCHKPLPQAAPVSTVDEPSPVVLSQSGGWTKRFVKPNFVTAALGILCAALVLALALAVIALNREKEAKAKAVAQVARLEQQAQESRKKRDQAQGGVKEWERKLKASQEERTRVEAQKKTEVERLTSKIDGLSRERKKAERERDDWARDYSSLEEQLKRVLNEKARLNDELAKMRLSIPRQERRAAMPTLPVNWQAVENQANRARTIDELFPIAEHDNAVAQYLIGMCFLGRKFKGQTISQDEKRAHWWLRHAAGQGHSGAQRELNDMGQSW